MALCCRSPRKLIQCLSSHIGSWDGLLWMSEKQERRSLGPWWLHRIESELSVCAVLHERETTFNLEATVIWSSYYSQMNIILMWATYLSFKNVLLRAMVPNPSLHGIFWFSIHFLSGNNWECDTSYHRFQLYQGRQ